VERRQNINLHGAHDVDSGGGDWERQARLHQLVRRQHVKAVTSVETLEPSANVRER